MIKLYSTHCPQCQTLAIKLDRAGIKYEICDDKEAMAALGLKAAPALDIGDQILNFSQAIKWVNNQR